MRISNTVKMAKEIGKWRESASCILLARNHSKEAEDGSDYKTLLFNRSANASFMPKASVFPGGVRESEDESLNWLEYFKEFGLTEKHLSDDFCIDRSRQSFATPGIFQNPNQRAMPRDISLRISAIRETFEEVGIMLCRDRDSLKDVKGGRSFGRYMENFDREHWQHRVHNDASQFLKLCQNLDVVPDLWGLNEWSVWLTPAALPTKRFEAVFYVVALEAQPNVQLEQTEGIDFMWRSPGSFLGAHERQECWLAPPQFYELSRLSQISQLNECFDFVRTRAKNGSILMLPVMVLTADGRMISVFPGDSFYPENPHIVSDLITVEKTAEEFRAESPKLHRVEQGRQGNHAFHINIELPDKQIAPNAAKLLANL